jgi:hypothetical protein
MYYFYINFPYFYVDPVKIHHADCGFCQNGQGSRGIGSNGNGFWAGPFENYADVESALQQLNSKFNNPPGFENVRFCNSGQ